MRLRSSRRRRRGSALTLVLVVSLTLGFVAFATASIALQGRKVEGVVREDADLAYRCQSAAELLRLEVVRHWRAAGRRMPVLILTARSSWQEKVAGMDAGADDYLAKPFHMEELLARLRALLRRLGEHASAEWQCGAISLDTRAARVLVAGQPLTLTSHEFKLLAQLMQRKGEVLSRTELAEHLYPQDSERDSNTIEVFVGRLRKKLPEGSIETVRGLGYRLTDGDAAAP